MSRRQAREIALQALFQMDLNHSEDMVSEEAQENFALDTALGECPPLTDKDRGYARALVRGTRENLSAIDQLITKSSREWKVERMAGVDRNITRIAVYEMKFSEDKLTPSIVINEAVELAKKFGTDDSGRYVNGILGERVK